MKGRIVFFTWVMIAGCFLLIMGVAGSHGHFRFRPQMTEDWLIFGTTLVGVVGLIWTIIKALKNRN
jgi:uncharacterized membrane protein HdeD (DUF308 family)